MLQTALGKTTATTRHVLASTGATTRQVLASTGATTKALLGTMSDANFWKDSLKWVRPLSQPRVKEQIKDEDDNVDVQWCHPFYESLVGSSVQSSKVILIFILCKASVKDFHILQAYLLF